MHFRVIWVHVMQYQQIESAIISVTVGRQRQLPVNLGIVANQIGAVVRRAYCRDGFTHFQPTGPVVYLGTAAYDIRTRFIIAHELAHIILRSPAAIHLIEQRGQVKLFDNEEDLANRIAGALLVPDNWIDGLKGTRLTARRLWDVACRAGIPISMLITRIENAGVDISLLHWRRGRNSWYVIDRPGTPPFLHRRIVLSDSGRKALEDLKYEESEVIVRCYIDGWPATITGMGFKWQNGEHVLQFLTPKDNVSF
jgi:hypothetical protein